MLSFLRNDLNQLQAYAPHPGGNSGSPIETQILDRLDTNECPYDLPEELKQKLAWTYQHEIETNRYPDGSHFPLKIAIANYINEIISNSEAFVNPEQISVGNGSDELIRSILIATCLGGEGSILVANPTFSMYGIIAQTLGISVVGIGRDKDTFEMDLNAAKTAIETTQNPPIRVVFVVHPNSPTANALTDNELDWLRQLPEQILVVIDEAYFEFSQTSVIEELKQHPNWVILRTFSKAFRLASLRAGYAIAHPELITALEKVRLPYNLPSFTQTAALLALNNCQDLLKVIPEILAERTNLINALTENKQLKIWRSDANFIYIRLTDEQNSDQALNQIMQQLKTKGTLVRHTGGGLRITVGRPDENQRTIERLFSIL
ncbi:Histidinol-phosphate aminotransferase [Planktothrix agardhii]|jgi:histidinol-phosphate aminotransferase|uniref:Histidinol-phosphate aminotransferase n=3 Tax=Planktothrix agardhii TaxID=1160 RepID=A0A1J1JKS0_PLAAG|nr:histidinol-phosphate transaminase [Planktothrix agardhii]AQY61205.1 Histidinol-phosphate aminotransferase [Planktothrix agardhii NIVA-CYA 68]MCF3574272.1 histidinol-phosphate transaminase [Planktothrix agardhii 1812]MCF3583245.1 histidinol-phosphate transaminase [Planktothrix agardhii 1811]MCF3627006.1 histidinol-phosphate transaminase [Planktothrix agardhii 1801]CAD5916506.1 Histidinol-phosphate aminotransferase [Planktothrix agardhii]